MANDNRKYSDRRDYLNSYYREYYSDPVNKAKILEKERNRSSNNRRAFYEWKKTLSCENCGENHSACIEFHHVDSSKKDYTISRMAGKSMKSIMKEVSKCKILCANCHRKLHNPI